MTKRLTLRELDAINSALSSMIAGVLEEGDPEREDLDSAQDKIIERIRSQRKRKGISDD